MIQRIEVQLEVQSIFLVLEPVSALERTLPFEPMPSLVHFSALERLNCSLQMVFLIRLRKYTSHYPVHHQPCYVVGFSQRSCFFFRVAHVKVNFRNFFGRFCHFSLREDFDANSFGIPSSAPSVLLLRDFAFS